jgi:hypothetical protein
MAIFAMHGVFRSGSSKSFVNRSFTEAEAFEAFLRALPTKFVTVDAALWGAGDALTIDDATKAAYEAAILARQHGHSVTLFINPYFVEHQRPHFFTRLNAALDRTELVEVTYRGSRFGLILRSEKRLLRELIKLRYCVAPTVNEAEGIVDEAISLLRPASTILPKQAQTLTIGQLEKLVERGVEIGNHGYSHLHPGALTRSVLENEIESASAWIRCRCDREPKNFAAPFGDALPRRPLPNSNINQWLILNDQVNPGRLGAQVWNRVPLKPSSIEKS